MLYIHTKNQFSPIEGSQHRSTLLLRSPFLFNWTFYSPNFSQPLALLNNQIHSKDRHVPFQTSDSVEDLCPAAVSSVGCMCFLRGNLTGFSQLSFGGPLLKWCYTLYLHAGTTRHIAYWAEGWRPRGAWPSGVTGRLGLWVGAPECPGDCRTGWV